jgi:hypothetical protein
MKVCNQLTPVCLQNLVNVKKSKYSFRYNNIVDIPQVKTTIYGKKSFRYAAYETLKLGKTALSPEMVREAVPHCSSCIAKALLTIDCRFYLRNIHNVVIPEGIFSWV